MWQKTIQSAGFNNVVVFYNDQPYQWLVKHVDKEEVYVWYIQSVGREIEISQYYWPKCVFVECWYRTDNVVCVRLMSQ